MNFASALVHSKKGKTIRRMVFVLYRGLYPVHQDDFHLSDEDGQIWNFCASAKASATCMGDMWAVDCIADDVSYGKV